MHAPQSIQGLLELAAKAFQLLGVPLPYQFFSSPRPAKFFPLETAVLKLISKAQACLESRLESLAVKQTSCRRSPAIESTNVDFVGLLDLSRSSRFSVSRPRPRCSPKAPTSHDSPAAVIRSDRWRSDMARRSAIRPGQEGHWSERFDDQCRTEFPVDEPD